MLGNDNRENRIFLSIRDGHIVRRPANKEEEPARFEWLVAIPQGVEERDVKWTGGTFKAYEMTFRDAKEDAVYVLSVGKSLLLSLLLTLNGNIETVLADGTVKSEGPVKAGTPVKLRPWVRQKGDKTYQSVAVYVDDKRVGWAIKAADIPQPKMVEFETSEGKKTFRDEGPRNAFIKEQMDIFNQRYGGVKQAPSGIPAPAEDPLATPVTPPPTVDDIPADFLEGWNM